MSTRSIWNVNVGSNRSSQCVTALCNNNLDPFKKNVDVFGSVRFRRTISRLIRKSARIKPFITGRTISQDGDAGRLARDDQIGSRVQSALGVLDRMDATTQP